jgi:hypothetical protein
MNWGSILQLIFSLFGLFETDLAIIEAGGVATSPVMQVGSVGGKPLYARAQLCTDKTFPGG